VRKTRLAEKREKKKERETALAREKAAAHSPSKRLTTKRWLAPATYLEEIVRKEVTDFEVQHSEGVPRARGLLSQASKNSLLWKKGGTRAILEGGSGSAAATRREVFYRRGLVTARPGLAPILRKAGGEEF